MRRNKYKKLKDINKSTTKKHTQQKDKTQTKEPKQTESSKIKDVKTKAADESDVNIEWLKNKGYGLNPEQLEKVTFSQLDKNFRELKDKNKILGIRTKILDERLSSDGFKINSYLRIDDIVDNLNLTNKFRNKIIKLDINASENVERVMKNIRKNGFNYLKKHGIGTYKIINKITINPINFTVMENLKNSANESDELRKLNDEFNKCFGKKINEKSK